MRKSLPVTVFAVFVLLWSSTASAGGYDTPILYTAKYIGAGGTAISDVNDASAMFHNPAGMGRTGFATALADVSLLFGLITGTPNEGGGAINVDSNLTIAPFFLVGGTIRALDWLTFGLAVYPVASAGATYEYVNDDTGDDWEDTTTLVFFEFAPGVAFTLPYNIHLGASYRIALVTLDRIQGNANGDKILDFSMSGINWLGFKVGAQWQPIEELAVGLVYRHKTVTKVTAETGTALALDGTDLETEFTLPSKLGFGIRGDIGPVAIKSDVEYTFQSQNEQSVLTGEAAIAGNVIELEAPNIFAWEDNITARFGVQYEILEDNLPIRLGYIFDQKTTSVNYPSAFGTPPGQTHVGTAGVGYGGDAWGLNFAYAFRTSAGDSTTADIEAQAEDQGGKGPCRLCGGAGEYRLQMHGVYLDFEWRFD